jgi:toxin HigB-1
MIGTARRTTQAAVTGIQAPRQADSTVSVLWLFSVIGTFADAATEDIWNGQETKAARTILKAIWPVVPRKLDLLNRVTRLDALRVPPGNRFEALKGGEAGSYSIRVNDQYRITFHFREGHFYEVCCEDYH